jgi:hypothetical protein
LKGCFEEDGYTYDAHGFKWNYNILNAYGEWYTTGDIIAIKFDLLSTTQVF